MVGTKLYTKKSVSQLLKIATKHFNAFIRKRDSDKACISCGKYTTLQAGHFYSAGNYAALRYDEKNVHGQCVKCNYFLSGNLLEYEKNLLFKIGEKALKELHLKAAIYKRTKYKWDHFSLIEIINKYK